MTAARLRAPRLLGVLAIAGLGAATGVLALVPAGPAAAHDYVVSSTPAAGSTVDSSPATVSITFNDVILDLSGTGSSNVLEVTDAAGLHYEDGCSTTSGPTLATGVALGAPGAYTMTYQAVSADGHTVSDAVPFTYAPAAGTAEGDGSPTRPSCGSAGGAGGDSGASSGDETAAASPSASTEPEMTTMATPGDDTVATPSAASESGSVNAGLVIGIAVAIVVLAAAGVVVAIVTGRRRDGTPAEAEVDDPSAPVGDESSDGR
ncbi:MULTISPECIES: copper resistance CopC family protein [unclassified Frigoribacterium]|uniref:copper resistance CopC family protein n=1 Tax=unclassified Frigoribacterium TaxID=2627005 RepID=UPI000B1B6DE5|nr:MULTISPECIES: copper resistance CopC family protein [unclassified Frigoribacterium]